VPRARPESRPRRRRTILFGTECRRVRAKSCGSA